MGLLDDGVVLEAEREELVRIQVFGFRDESNLKIDWEKNGFVVSRLVEHSYVSVLKLHAAWMDGKFDALPTELPPDYE